MIDFGALAARLLSQSRSLLPAWFPEGRFSGHEFLVGSLSGEKGKSLSINWTTGRWADFASGEKGGDLVSLYAAVHHVTQVDAGRFLDDTPAATTPVHEKEKRQVIAPVPDGVPICACLHYKFGKAVRVWTYRDGDGKVLGHVARYEPKDDDEKRDLYQGRNKQVIPWTYAKDAKGKGRWGAGSWPVPRPLYGLDDLATRKEDPVLIVEGEKAADAARKIAHSYVVIAYPGGGHSWQKADWSPLKGREVLLWPDNVPPGSKDPGIEVMWPLGHMLLKHCPKVKIVIADDESKPEGWDAADALADGYTWAQFKEWAVPRLQQLFENGGQDEGTNKRGDQVPGAGDSNAVHSAEPAASDPRNDGEGNRGSEVVANGKGGAQENVPDVAGEAAKPEDVHQARARREVKWYAWGLDLNGQGVPFSNLNNATHVLERVYPGRIWFDEFLQRFMTIGSDSKPREWSDADDVNLALEMQRVIGIRTMSSATCSEAVTAVAMRNVKNCVRDYLDGLAWDGVPRISKFFEDHFGAQGTAYIASVSKNFWLSMVARIYEPGCKMDNTVVLEGGQGVGKSSAVAAIGGQWYMEQKEDVDDKDFYQVIQGRWVIEISEMHSFNRAAMSGVKRTISSMTDRYRASYDRRAADHPRQCVFICTTNHYDWNKDETGARRFWPVRCAGDVDVHEVRRRRNDLFAEAVAVYKAAGVCEACLGHPSRRCEAHDWWTMPFEETLNEQRNRFDADPWLESITEFVSLRTEVRVMEVLTERLKIEEGKVGRADQMRVASCLRILGWEWKNTRIGGSVVKVWTKSDE